MQSFSSVRLRDAAELGARPMLLLLERARRAHAAALVAESLLVAAAAAGFALSAGAAQGEAPGTPGAWLIALVAAVSAGAAWWRGSRRSPWELARAIDRGAQLKGAFVTAYEHELGRDADACSLSALLSLRMARRIAPELAIRLALPSPAPALLAPVLALAVLLLLTRAEPEQLPGGALEERVRVASTSLASAAKLFERAAASAAGRAAGTGQDDSVQVQAPAEVARLVEACQELADDTARLAQDLVERGAGAPSAAEVAQRLTGIERRLAAAQSASSLNTAESPEARSALAQASAEIGAASLRVRQTEPVRDASGTSAALPSAGAAAPASSAPSPSANTAGAARGEDRLPALASAPSQGTMSGSSESTMISQPAPSPNTQLVPAASGPDFLGRGVARWWDVRHDRLVERWVEWSRLSESGD